jgi:excisionase family DNA binding protein
MLSVDEVARHYGFRPDTVRRRIRTGELGAVRIRRTYRLDWRDVWTCENGPMPKGARIARYQERLLTKKEIARALGVSVKTVERWIADGMPTRCVFGAVRCNPHDVADWLCQAMDVRLPEDWWKQ